MTTTRSDGPTQSPEEARRRDAAPGQASRQATPAAPGIRSAAGLLALQRTAGNRAAAQLLAPRSRPPRVVQRKQIDEPFPHEIPDPEGPDEIEDGSAPGGGEAKAAPPGTGDESGGDGAGAGAGAAGAGAAGAGAAG
ncbi:MAG: hypothetical protein KY469_19425, partial [Actinobacteria bacterium]|nr:hypothetical protein [Actinomycetota bacterium]